jgi:L-rhamnose isomerase
MDTGMLGPKDLFFQYYESYCVAKDRQDVHTTKFFAMLSIGQVHKLAGDRYKDVTESATIIKNLFESAYITDKQALAMYEELFRDSRQ